MFELSDARRGFLTWEDMLRFRLKFSRPCSTKELTDVSDRILMALVSLSCLMVRPIRSISIYRQQNVGMLYPKVFQFFLFFRRKPNNIFLVHTDPFQINNILKVISAISA